MRVCGVIGVSILPLRIPNEIPLAAPAILPIQEIISENRGYLSKEITLPCCLNIFEVELDVEFARIRSKLGHHYVVSDKTD